MGRVVLLGDPVAHSLSPAMQNAAFSAVGLPHRYELMRVPVERLGGAILALRGDDFVGANVTIPHKLNAFPLVDVREERAARIRSINTIFKRDGRLHGDSTDGVGFAEALRERGVEVAGRRVLLLGAGGAARACLDVLIERGAYIDVADRTAERAVVMGQEMVGLFSDRHTRARQRFSVLGGAPGDVAGYDVLVNATSLGMHGESALEEVALPASLAVVDVVATRDETPLIARARASGCVVVDGLLMLLHQGVRAFTLWTGLEAPVDAMRAALPRRV